MSTEESRAWKDQYMLRLPDGMRDRLKDEAAKNNRSLNAEIVSRLVASFGPSTATMFAVESGQDGFSGHGQGGVVHQGEVTLRPTAEFKSVIDGIQRTIALTIDEALHDAVAKYLDATEKIKEAGAPKSQPDRPKKG